VFGKFPGVAHSLRSCGKGGGGRARGRATAMSLHSKKQNRRNQPTGRWEAVSYYPYDTLMKNRVKTAQTTGKNRTGTVTQERADAQKPGASHIRSTLGKSRLENYFFRLPSVPPRPLSQFCPLTNQAGLGFGLRFLAGQYDQGNGGRIF